ncbi:MAG: hypothetical protein Alpg2KO_25860 [Alphaproteobacteria bacterium]
MVEMVFRSTGVGICITNEDCCFVACNPAWLKHYGYTADQVLGRKFTMVVPPENREYAEDLHRRYLRGETEESPGEWTVETRGGQQSTIYVTAERFVDRDGNRYKVTSVTDISDRKMAEVALAESEQRFRDLASCSNDWFWETDPRARITYLSDRFESLTAVNEGDVIGLPLIDLFDSSLSPDDFNSMAGAITGRQAFRNVEVAVSQRLPALRWLRLAGVPSFTPDGVFRGYRGVATDITELKARIAMESQSRRMDSLGQLSGRISHEINNLLQPMISYLHMAQEDARKGEAVDRYLDRTIELSGRMRDIASEILTFASSDGGAREQCQLVNEVRRALAIIEESEIPRGIKLVTDNMTDDDGRVEMSSTMVMQVLINLIRNAIFAMVGKGRIEVTLTTSNPPTGRMAARQLNPGRYFVLSVSDNGPGMDERTAAMVFEPFFTTRQAGTGLGLSTIYGLVKGAGGAIFLTTKQGQGARFDCWVPIMPEHV